MAFIKNSDSKNFDFGETEVLRGEIENTNFSKTIVDKAQFPKSEIEALAVDYELSDDEKIRLKDTMNALEVIYLRVNSSKSAGKEEEDEEEEEEEVAEEEEEDDGTGKAIDFFITKYTYKIEMKEFALRLINSNLLTRKIFDFLVFSTEKGGNSLEYVKEKIKKLLSFMGIESIFVGLEFLANKNFLIKHLFKLIGSALLPILLLVGIFLQLVKLTNNPLQAISKWITKTFDIKIPGADEE